MKSQKIKIENVEPNYSSQNLPHLKLTYCARWRCWQVQWPQRHHCTVRRFFLSFVEILLVQELKRYFPKKTEEISRNTRKQELLHSDLNENTWTALTASFTRFSCVLQGRTLPSASRGPQLEVDPPATHTSEAWKFWPMKFRTKLSSSKLLTQQTPPTGNPCQSSLLFLMTVLEGDWRVMMCNAYQCLECKWNTASPVLRGYIPLPWHRGHGAQRGLQVSVYGVGKEGKWLSKGRLGFVEKVAWNKLYVDLQEFVGHL